MTSPAETRRLGQTGVELGAIGYGTWQWGDTRYWGYGRKYSHEDIAAAFHETVGNQSILFDSAEIYGGGASERILGALAQKNPHTAFVSSKYAPLPTRLRAQCLDTALDRSLKRLGMERIDLYLIHWPLSLVPHSRLVAALARAVRDGRVGSVGISNFPADAMRRVHAQLADEGLPLAANQVQYSLVRRAPEVNGVLEACHELGVTLIAHTPLGQGLLSGKYDLAHKPTGLRRWSRQFRSSAVRQALPILQALQDIATEHSVTPPQVSIAWLLRDARVLPIPGVKTAEQARDLAAACHLSLDDTEIRRLNTASENYRRIPRLSGRFIG